MTAATPAPLGTPIVRPIHHSAAYAFETLADAREVFAQRASGFTYARTGNPNVAALEAEVARLEGGECAVATSSGQAAVSLALLTLTGPAKDAHVVVSSRIYGGTVDLLTDTLADTGLEVTFADPREPQQWEDALRPGTRVFFLESVANPLTELPELEAIAEIAHRNGVVVIVDNTVATPHLYTPGRHGADLVVHSATKYLSGHGGPLGGVLVDTGSFDPTEDPERWPWLTRKHHRWGDRSPVEVFGARRALLGVARCKYLNDLGPCMGATTAHEILQGITTLCARGTPVRHGGATRPHPGRASRGGACPPPPLRGSATATAAGDRRLPRGGRRVLDRPQGNPGTGRACRELAASDQTRGQHR